jgi:hypothetical protein
MGKIPNPQRIEIKYHPDIIASRNLTEASMLKLYNELTPILKNKFKDIVPTDLNGIGNLDYLIELHEIFTGVKEINGFDRHLKVYDKDINANLFVAKIAYALKKKGMSVTFEPEVKSSTGRNPDIELKHNSQTIYLECKTILQAQLADSVRHTEIYSILDKYTQFPHQVRVHYKNDFGDDSFDKLGQSIQKLLSKVTSNGMIVNNDDYKVDVDFRDHFEKANFDIQLSGVDLGPTRVPFTSFFKRGRTVIVGGPKTDFTKVIREKIGNGRTQAIDGYPFIIIINSDFFLGSLENNIMAVDGLFQPERNTRISGIFFTESETLPNKVFDHYIKNPFAKCPVTIDMEQAIIKG